MLNRQKYAALFISFFILLTFTASYANAKRKIKGKTFYTMANILYEHPAKIFSTNYHRGTLLPVGTKVTIKRVNRKKIQFISDKSGEAFTIIFLRKHMNRITEWNYFDQYFSEKNPMREGGPFQKFSEDEKRNIKIGNIAEGMSKEAVLMAYGYPPSHRTTSLESNVWIYWTSRIRNQTVFFENNRVIDIKR